MRSVAEPLTGVNEVGVGEVVQLGDALPSVGPEDAAEGFSTLDDMHTRPPVAVDPLAAVDVPQ